MCAIAYLRPIHPQFNEGIVLSICSYWFQPLPNRSNLEFWHSHLRLPIDGTDATGLFPMTVEPDTRLLSQIFCSKLCKQKFFQPNRLLVLNRYDIPTRTYPFL